MLEYFVPIEEVTWMPRKFLIISVQRRNWIQTAFCNFFSQPAAVPLEKMIVRETATDDRGLFLISMIDERMYSLKLSTAENCIDMAQAMRLAIEKCSDEGNWKSVLVSCLWN